jgi:hypothetical protein
LEAGRVRRLLARTLLVLGGAVTATVVGWLLCSGSASADVLPGVPVVPVQPTTIAGVAVPSVTGVVDPQQGTSGRGTGQTASAARPVAKSTAKPVAKSSGKRAVRATHTDRTKHFGDAVVSSVTGLVTDELPTAQLPTAPLPTVQLPSTGLSDAHLPDTPAALGSVVRQVHNVVVGFGDRVTPAVAPATALVPLHLGGLGITPVADDSPGTVAHPLGRAATPQSAPRAVRLSMPATGPGDGETHQHLPMIVAHQTTGATDSTRAADSAPASGDSHNTGDNAGRHLPALPPAQPLGSSDSGAHSPAGPTGGTGGAQVLLTHSLDAALTACGASSSPRLAVVPGKQPGTSPD